MAQGGDGLVALPFKIDQFLLEHAEDSVPGREDAAEGLRVAAHGLDHAAGAGIDDGGDTAGLGIEDIVGHWSPVSVLVARDQGPPPRGVEAESGPWRGDAHSSGRFAMIRALI
jgi:hypothetical protein